MYVLRPDEILPQISLTEAIYWIAFGSFPLNSFDINNPCIQYQKIETGGNFGLEKFIDASIITEDAIQRLNLPYNTFCHVSMGEPIFSEEGYNKVIELLNISKHRFFAAFTEKRIQLFGAKENNNRNFFTKSEEFIKIKTDQIQYEDFDWDNMKLKKTNDTTYDSLLVSTDDLLKEYNLEFSNSKQVKLAANNYFIDDDENDEIKIIETAGRKSTLPPHNIALIAGHCKELLDKSPGNSQKFYIHSCIDWANKEFETNLAYQTVRGWLLKLLENQKN